MITHDFSDWATALFDYSISLLTHQDVLRCESNSPRIVISDSYDSKVRTWISSPISAHLWWLGIGVGIECLAKSTLLKHEVLSIRKKDLPAKAANCSLRDVKLVYDSAATMRVSATTNHWLDRQLKSQGINGVYEITTPTLGAIAKEELPRLQSAGKIDAGECRQLREYLSVFADIRRNNDAHIYLKTQVLWSIQDDVEKVIIPLVNQLIRIYQRP